MVRILSKNLDIGCSGNTQVSTLLHCKLTDLSDKPNNRCDYRTVKPLSWWQSDKKFNTRMSDICLSIPISSYCHYIRNLSLSEPVIFWLRTYLPSCWGGHCGVRGCHGNSCCSRWATGCCWGLCYLQKNNKFMRMCQFYLSLMRTVSQYTFWK